MKAGDIVATRSNSGASRLIQAFTGSRWSHVAIATGGDLILEATKERRKCRRTGDEVRERPLADFLNDKDEVVCFVRPGELTKSEEDKLGEYSRSVVGIKNYTTLHAGLTALGRTLWFAVGILLVWIGCDEFENFQDNSRGFLMFMATMSGVLATWAYLLIWASRLKVGVKTMENIYRTFSYGSYLVDVKYSLFCSRLVLQADDAIGGPLSARCPNDEEVQPKHIVKECRDMDWDEFDLRL